MHRAISRQPLTIQTWTPSKVSPCRICDGEISFFFRVILLFLVSNIPPVPREHISFIYLRNYVILKFTASLNKTPLRFSLHKVILNFFQGRIRLCKEKLRNCQSSPNILKAIKSRRIGLSEKWNWSELVRTGDNMKRTSKKQMGVNWNNFIQAKGPAVRCYEQRNEPSGWDCPETSVIN
jgi:hypothetical protein